MTKCKWTKFYPSDFLRGIRHLNVTEVAAYIIVLCEMYDHEGNCPRDDAKMADLCRFRQWQFTKALDGLIAKGKVDFYAGRLTNKRVTEEIENRMKSALKKADERAHNRSVMKHDASTTQARRKHGEFGKLNQINGNSGHVHLHKEIREDKKESFLDAEVFETRETLDMAERRKRALEDFEKRRRQHAGKGH